MTTQKIEVYEPKWFFGTLRSASTPVKHKRNKYVKPIGPCNLVLLVHHRLMGGEKSVHDSRIGAEPFLHCET